RKSNRNPLDWYSDADEAYVRQALKQFLVDDYGYDYEDWSSRTPAESATGLVEYQTQQVKS
ncbi:MAG: hypothetical protein AAF711_19110, partial [Planctomycetota bacterium]